MFWLMRFDELDDAPWRIEGDAKAGLYFFFACKF